jgi:RNA polymerase sigma-70 factor (ECF subfamily)
MPEPILAVEDEVALVLAAGRGDQDAFRRLYDANVGLVFAYLSRRVGAQVAEDLAAEVFARAYRSLPRYQPRGVPLRAWLLRIAHNLVVGRARRRATSEVPLADPDAAGRPAVAASGEAEALRQLDADLLASALEQLADSHHAVLELRFLRELSVAETATILDQSQEAVRSLTYRALQALRAQYLALAGGG